MRAALYSLPGVALAPLFILWFGIGLMSNVMLAVSIVYFIMLYSVYSGVRNVDVDLLNAVRTMGASDRYLTRRIVLPSQRSAACNAGRKTRSSEGGQA